MTERLSNEWPCDDCKRTVFCGACERPGIWMNKARKKLEEYEIAEEEGRLVVLPCKVGTTVYVIDYIWDYGEIGDKAKRNYFIKRMSFKYGMISVFNKTVFLTQGEAEKALEELRNEGND